MNSPPAASGDADAPPASSRLQLPLACLLAALLLAITLFNLRQGVPAHRFTYDEADYMFAASRGWAENYLDTSVIGVGDFLARGREALGGGASKTALSQYIREAADISFYRHFHGPLYFYWLEAGRELLGEGERPARQGSAALLLLTMAVALMGSLALWGRGGLWPGFLALGLLAQSPLCWLTWTQITPHALFAPVALAHLFCLALSLKTGERRFLHGAAAALGLSLLTIEYAPLLLLTMAACLFVWRRTLFAGLSPRQVWAFLGKLALLGLGLAAALWPGGLIKLTVVRDYIFFVYLMLLRADAYGEGQGFWQTWAERLAQAPAEFAWLALGVGLFLYAARRRGAAWGSPFLIFAGLLLATTLRNRSASPTYLCAVIASLHLVGVVGLTALLASLNLRGRRVAWGGLALGLLAAGAGLSGLGAPARVLAAGGGNLPLEWAIWGDATVESLLRHPPDPGLALLTPNVLLPTLHYYLPGQRLIPYTQEQAGQVLVQRVQGKEPMQVIFLSRWGVDPRQGLEAAGRAARTELLADAPRFGQVRYLRVEQGGGCDC
jgi:hypothetical protein